MAGSRKQYTYPVTAVNDVEKKGKIKERLDRIAQLEETWEKLCLHHENKERLTRDKINLLRLLGKEYAAVFMFEKAEEAFQKALALDQKIGAGLEAQLLVEIGEFYNDFERYEKSLQFLLRSIDTNGQLEDAGVAYHLIGMAYLGLQRWDKAMEYYNLSLEWDRHMGYEFRLGSTFHEIGRTFQKQRMWVEALSNYRQALESKKRSGNESNLGLTYHQIGRVFEEQEKWEEALRNYHEALEWNKRTGNEYAVGITYHQIGRVFEEQEKWEEALQNYQEALDWKKRTSNEYILGNTYHQIGRVFEQQQNWEEALKNYQLALEWYQRTNNEYEMPGSYHQMGSVEESRGNLTKALVHYVKAVELARQHNLNELPLTQQSLDRIRQILADQKES